MDEHTWGDITLHEESGMVVMGVFFGWSRILYRGMEGRVWGLEVGGFSLYKGRGNGGGGGCLGWKVGGLGKVWVKVDGKKKMGGEGRGGGY
jgi:hypothetical protein